MIKNIFLVMFMCFFLTSCNQKRPHGVSNGKLLDCPDYPNCINSFAKEGSKSYVEPILFNADNSILDKIIIIIQGIPRTKMIEHKDNYLHFEFKTILGFVDDVEFYINDSNELHFRSASRVGYYDFNANRKRYLKIKRLISQSDSS